MLRTFAVGSFLVLAAARSLAHGQDIPALEPPVTDQAPASTPLAAPSPAPPASKPAIPAHSTPDASRLPAPRSMLVIPGVTAPPRRSTASAGVPANSSASSSLPRESGSGAAAPPSVAPPVSRSPFQLDGGPNLDELPEPSALPPTPLTIEPLGDDLAKDRARNQPPRNNAARTGPNSDADRPRDAERPPRLPPWRSPNFLGRALGRPGGDRRSPESAGGANRKERDRDPSTAEPESPDAIAKRRIEAQIRSILGDRVQGVEVRVTGRNVLIVARSTRFWQKRAVQRALESLPALAGYRARVDLSQ